MNHVELKKCMMHSQQLAKQGIIDNVADENLANACFDYHSAAVAGKWNAGMMQYVWRNQLGILCVQYKSTLRWQYTWDENNDCLTWR